MDCKFSVRCLKIYAYFPTIACQKSVKWLQVF
jgi:hypothetical protein